METLRAKFKCDSITDYGSNFQETKLSAVYAGDKNAEDNQFANATPSGELKMSITNTNAFGFLKPGKKYYLDFTEAPE